MAVATDRLARAREKLHDPAWYYQHCRILDKQTGQLVAFDPNWAQREYLEAWAAADAAGVPWRSITVKARQVGQSTAIQVEFSRRVNTRAFYKTLTLSHEEDSTKVLHGMSELIWEHLPTALTPERTYWEKGKSVSYRHGASQTTKTAANRKAGRSTAIRGLHGSEVAHWPEPGETMLAAMNAVADEPGTAIALESTANGQGDWFHQEWLAALAGETAFVPFFFGWHRHPLYRLALPEVAHAAFVRSMTKDEAQLYEEGFVDHNGVRIHLSLEQMAWRRETIRTKCGRDLDYFHQEYPLTAEEAFLASGRLFFDPSHISLFIPRNPIRTGFFDHRAVDLAQRHRRRRKQDRVEIPFVSQTAGELEIWEKPVKDRRYAGGIDIAGEISPEDVKLFRDKRDAADYSAIWIVDRMTFNTVAVWHSRMDPDKMAEEAYVLGRFFNDCLFAPEMTGGYGLVVQAVLERLTYPALYRREILDERGKVDTEKIGWQTTVNTRPLMLEGLRSILRDSPEKLRKEGLRREMSTFIVNRNRKPEAGPGSHDDLIMAAAIAYELARENPQRAPLRKKRTTPNARPGRAARQRTVAQRAPRAA